MNQSLKASTSSFHRHLGNRLDSDRRHSHKDSPLELSLRSFGASDPGGTLATARSFGLFSGKRRIKQTVGKKDKDFYQFAFNDLTDLRLTLTNRSKGNIFGDILDSQGQIVTFKGDRLSIKVKSGEAIENFYEELPSGTYFLRVRSREAGKNTYKLKLSAANTFPSLPDCGCTP